MQPDSLRLAVFLAVFVLVAVAQVFWPRQAQTGRILSRWGINLGFLALDTVLARLLFPLMPVGLALICEERGWGLVNLVQMPVWMAWVLGILALDFIIYAQHALFHHAPWLWRLHRVHHIDRFIDVSTALRFHPLEIVLSTLIKLAAVLLLGAPAGAVLVFEMLLNGCAMFNHGNIRLPAGFDRWLRRVIVTPDMHRVHHSELKQENQRNFGFALSWWDRLCGTYLASPSAGLEDVVIGLADFRNPDQLGFAALLKNPFAGKTHKILS